MIAVHVSDYTKNIRADSLPALMSAILARGGYVVGYARSNTVMWDDFPARSQYARPVEVPPLDIDLLLRRG